MVSSFPGPLGCLVRLRSPGSSMRWHQRLQPGISALHPEKFDKLMSQPPSSGLIHWQVGSEDVLTGRYFYRREQNVTKWTTQSCSSLLSSWLPFTLSRAKPLVQHKGRAAGVGIIFPETTPPSASKAVLESLVSLGVALFSLKTWPQNIIHPRGPSRWTNSQLFSHERVSKLNYRGGI